MKITKKHLFVFVFILSLILIQVISFSASEVSAGTLWDLQTDRSSIEDVGKAFGATDPSNPTDIRDVTINIIKVFLTFVGIICIILIIIGGVKWMTSQGEEEKVRKAKGQIQAAVIGLIIILASYTITNFIADCVFDLHGGSSTWMCR